MTSMMSGTLTDTPLLSRVTVLMLHDLNVWRT